MENNTNFTLRFDFGRGEAGSISVDFDQNCSLTDLQDETNDAIQSLVRFRNIEGISRKTAVIPLHRKFTLSFLKDGAKIRFAVEKVEYSPKSLNTTVGQIVAEAWNIAQKSKGYKAIVQMSGVEGLN